MDNNQAVANLDPIDAELAALLAADPDDSLFAESEEIVVDEAIVDDDAIDDDAIEAAATAIEMEEAREEIHAEQEAESEVDLETPTPDPVKKKAVRVSTTGMRPSKILATKLGGKLEELMAFDISDGELAPDAFERIIEERLAAIDKLPKKVGEKAVNVLCHLAGQVALSNYTAIALKCFEHGETTVGDIRAAYKARPYSDGTANAQSSQMMALLPALGIAKRTGKTLQINETSTLASLLIKSDE